MSQKSPTPYLAALLNEDSDEEDEAYMQLSFIESAVANQKPDIRFLVGKEPIVRDIPAHREIVAQYSLTLRERMYEQNGSNIIRITDVEPKIFLKLITYFYKKEIPFESDDVLQCLHAARLYKIQAIENEATKYAMNHINAENCFLSVLAAMEYNMPDIEAIAVAEIATLAGDIIAEKSVDRFWKFCDTHKKYNLSKAHKLCYRFIDLNGISVLDHPRALQLSADELLDIISRPSIATMRIEIFKFITRWIPNHLGENWEAIRSAIRLENFTSLELVTLIRPSRLFRESDILDALEDIIRKSDPSELHRPKPVSDEIRCLPDINVASEEYDVRLLSGTVQNDCNLFSLVIPSDYRRRGRFVYHFIDKSDKIDMTNYGITIDLVLPTRINRIELLLWENEDYPYLFSYYIEVSIDGYAWCRVADRTESALHSWQDHYFASHVCKFIRVVGTRDSEGYGSFCLSAVRAMYATSIIKDLVCS